ncbi:MFS transporter [Sanghuangporus baumii]|uniref:MFS transporter n=1 Tax=Sanghuangporus baumii TaxID=108892 RepID=A0A9Q5MYG1_SANBA|nr:MFS transporter [Sanghuangporus baumii]
MVPPSEKHDREVSITEDVELVDDDRSEDYRMMSRKILMKLDLQVLPPLALLWLANFIDRTNIGNARIAGLEKDTHLHGNQFNTALAVFYVSYIASELPSNWILKRMKPNRWLPFIVTAWGIVTTLSGLVQNFGGLVAIRIMLGLCEGGLLPGIILYLSTIYKKHELQLRVGVFYASASLSGAFGGLLATAIIKMEGVGGMAGWQWIFILEGLVTILFGILAAVLLPADIQSSRLLTPEERAFALRRFRKGNVAASHVPLSEAAQKIREEKAETQGVGRQKAGRASQEEIFQEDEQFEWGEVIRGSCKDIQTWLTGIGSFLTCSSARNADIVVIAFLADRLKWRGPFILIMMPLTIAGYILAIKAETNDARYAAVFLMAAGVYPSAPCILSILPNNSSGHYKKATTTALQLMIANTGGFIATFAYTSDQAPRYIRGHTISLAFVCLTWIAVAANVLYCLWENKARAEGRRQGNIERYQELWDSGKTRAPIGDRSPDFRFTL